MTKKEDKELSRLQKILGRQTSRVPGYTDLILIVLTLKPTERIRLLKRITDALKLNGSLKILKFKKDPWTLMNSPASNLRLRPNKSLTMIDVDYIIDIEFKCPICKKKVKESVYSLFLNDKLENCRNCIESYDKLVGKLK